MKKIMNNPKDFVAEFLEGISLAYPDQLEVFFSPEEKMVLRREKKHDKVAIVTAGGSGHLPLFLGYVGKGMLDGCAVGNVFASPSSEVIGKMIKSVDTGKGVLCLYGNYGGDKMNFHMAQEFAEFDGIQIREVIVHDDIASSNKAEPEKRRGVAGMVYAFKIAGAAAELGLSLNEVADIAESCLKNIRSMGVATSPCIVPEVGKATFSIDESEIEIGMGIHGEPGIEVRHMMTADEIAEELLERISDDLRLEGGEEVSVMVNGLGATPLEELLILYRSIAKLLEKKNIRIYMPHIGEYATSMEMAGCSITVFRLTKQFKDLLRADCRSPFYTNANI